MHYVFAGTPSLTIVKVLLSVAAERGMTIMLLGVKCAFLYSAMRRIVYIELPLQDPRSGDSRMMGKLKKAMHGTRNAPRIWSDMVREQMRGIGSESSVVRPSLYWQKQNGITAFVHVDDVLMG